MSLNSWLIRPFELLESRKEKWILILTTGIFAILFLNLYMPFNAGTWHSNASVPLFIALSGYGVIGMIILSISQFIIRPFINLNKFKYQSFIVWFICELIILGFVMFLIYGDTSLTGMGLLKEFLQILRYTFLVLALPYAGVLYYLYSNKQKQKLFHIDKTDDQIIKILDENQNVRIAIEPDKLLYIKNADNYVEIFYSNKGIIAKELVRTSLKRLEFELKKFNVSRCHRSYMVNVKNISLSKKTKHGIVLELKVNNSPQIPVSKNYQSIIQEAL